MDNATMDNATIDMDTITTQGSHVMPKVLSHTKYYGDWLNMDMCQCLSIYIYIHVHMSNDDDTLVKYKICCNG